MSIAATPMDDQAILDCIAWEKFLDLLLAGFPPAFTPSDSLSRSGGLFIRSERLL